MDKSVVIGSVYAEKHKINNHTQEITQIQVHEEEENSNDTSKEVLTRAMLVKGNGIPHEEKKLKICCGD